MNFNYAVSYFLGGLITWIICFCGFFFMFRFMFKIKKWLNIIFAGLLACVVLLLLKSFV